LTVTTATATDVSEVVDPLFREYGEWVARRLGQDVAQPLTRGAFAAAENQLQPLVLPHDGQAWQEPARCICTPHCMQ
jgi:hypothetical protein